MRTFVGVVCSITLFVLLFITALRLEHKVLLVVNGNVWSEYNFAELPCTIDSLIHLIMINNPTHNPRGIIYYQYHHQTLNSDNKLTY